MKARQGNMHASRHGTWKRCEWDTTTNRNWQSSLNRLTDSVWPNEYLGEGDPNFLSNFVILAQEKGFSWSNQITHVWLVISALSFVLNLLVSPLAKSVLIMSRLIVFTMFWGRFMHTRTLACNGQYTRVRARACTYTHARTYANTHAHIYTCTHTSGTFPIDFQISCSKTSPQKKKLLLTQIIGKKKYPASFKFHFHVNFYREYCSLAVVCLPHWEKNSSVLFSPLTSLTIALKQPFTK